MAIASTTDIIIRYTIVRTASKKAAISKQQDRDFRAVLDRKISNPALNRRCVLDTLAVTITALRTLSNSDHNNDDDDHLDGDGGDCSVADDADGTHGYATEDEDATGLVPLLLRLRLLRLLDHFCHRSGSGSRD